MGRHVDALGQRGQGACRFTEGWLLLPDPHGLGWAALKGGKKVSVSEEGSTSLQYDASGKYLKWEIFC